MRSTQISELAESAKRYLVVLESMFGPRDLRFAFGTIRKSDDGPRTFYPGGFHLKGGCQIDIWISKNCWERQDLNTAKWEIAHECVHLLDPSLDGTANVLEEGLATWFQDEPDHHPDSVRRVIPRDCDDHYRQEWVNARNLVRPCMPDMIGAIRQLRAFGCRIGCIGPDRLKTFLPETDWHVIRGLCRPFA